MAHKDWSHKFHVFGHGPKWPGAVQETINGHHARLTASGLSSALGIIGGLALLAIFR
jgi:hypothetical protein